MLGFLDHWSNVIESWGKNWGDLLTVEDLCLEFAAFLGVLKNWWNFDGACPVAVAEALREDYLLEMSFFKFAIWVDDSVVVGDCASSWLLTDNIEIVFFADNIWSDYCSWENVSDLISDCEESFAVLEVDHNNNNVDICFVGIADVFFEGEGEVFLDEIDLRFWNGQHKDNYCFRWCFVSGGISLDAADGCVYHALVLFFSVFDWDWWLVDKWEGRVDGGAGRHHGEWSFGCWVDSHETGTFKNIAHFCS